MADFNKALAYTLVREGGIDVTTDSDKDNGHITRAGLTQATVSSYLGRPVTYDQMVALSHDVISAIYRKLYWASISGDTLTQQIVATCLFDMSVLMGPLRAAMIAQQALSLTADGKIGPKSLAALNSVGIGFFVSQFTEGCNAFLKQIVAKDASQQVWLAGWLKRTALLAHLPQASG